MTPHSHADIEINYLTSGWIRYFHGGRFYEIPQGRLAVFWAGIPHQLTAHSPRFEGVWITFPVNWLLGWQIPGPFQDGILAGDLRVERDGQAYEVRTEEERLRSWLEVFDTGLPERRQIVILELEARLRRMGAGFSRVRPARRKRTRENPSHFVRMTEYLARNYTRPMAVEDVARDLGLHPKYSMALFKKTCGMTLWNYLVRLRTAHAERLLLTTDLGVLELALAAGFGSLSAFYLAFQKHTGMTPARFRRMHART